MTKIDKDQALDALDRAKSVYMASPFPGRFLKVTKVEVRQHLRDLRNEDPVWIKWHNDNLYFEHPIEVQDAQRMLDDLDFAVLHGCRQRLSALLGRRTTVEEVLGKSHEEIVGIKPGSIRARLDALEAERLVLEGRLHEIGRLESKILKGKASRTEKAAYAALRGNVGDM